MKAEPHPISEVLMKNATSFFIPPFQRSYAWGGNEIERYFSDIIRIIDSELDKKQADKLEHFFGTIVIRNENNGFATKSIIVDGQQRLTTTLLFLIALRDIDENAENKKNITNLYLTNSESTFPDKIKLKQVTSDWDSYRALINGNKHNATGQIKVAYSLFVKLISAEKAKRPEIEFKNYISALNKFNVAVIFLDERPFKGEDPQIIFETLNSLGKPLSLSDLIRNYILLNMKSEDQTDTYENVWYPKIEKQLSENTSCFFRDFLQYKTSSDIKVANDNNTKEIYQQFKNFVEDEYQTHKEFVDDIVQYVPLYKCIILEQPSEKISNNENNDKTIKELLRNIFHDIKSESFKPFVLGLLFEYFKNPSLDDILIENLKVIRTYLIRRRILGLTQAENKNIPLLCSKINQIIENKITLIKILTNLFYKLRFPNDDEMTTALGTVNFYEGLRSYCKFILGKIEENNAKVAVDFRNKKITIEHIMPQTLTDAWNKELGENYLEIHKNYLHNLGNLILTEFNDEMGNKSFSDKKEKLKTSSLNFRLEIINQTNWNEESIKQHQTKMINDFLTTFPLPPENQHSMNYNSLDKGKENMDLDFFPLNEDIETIGYSKPYVLKINDKEFKTKSWQDTYIQFLKFIKDSNIYDFRILLENQKEIFGREDAVVLWKEIKDFQDKDLKKYKNIDGKYWSDIKNISDNLCFFHINFSAQSCIMRIAKIMKKFGMDENFVKIKIKF